jgi:outer membrane protein OmpA-like peptidoglycan-associated protein
MKSLQSLRVAALSAALLGLASCATTPPGPPADIVRLQHEQDRLHSDPRIVDNGGTELANADAAVATLSQNARALEPRDYEQGVYLAGKLLQVAEASALARSAERRGEILAGERDRMLAHASTRTEAPMISTAGRADDSSLRDRPADAEARARLFAMQGQLVNSESRVDERGLVVRLAAFNFRPDQTGLTSTGEQSLTSLARAMGSVPDATARIVAYGDDRADGSDSGEHAALVRDYLHANGVDSGRLALREARDGAPARGARGDVLIVVRE